MKARFGYPKHQTLGKCPKCKKNSVVATEKAKYCMRNGCGYREKLPYLSVYYSYSDKRVN